jgi:hypothetical protein
MNNNSKKERLRFISLFHLRFSLGLFCCWRATRLYFAKPGGFGDGDHGQSVCRLQANPAGFCGGTPNIADLALKPAGFVLKPAKFADCFISITALHHEGGSHS